MIGHKVEGSDAFLAKSRGGGFGFESGTFQDNTLVPVERLLNRIPGVAVTAAVNDAADGDAVWVVKGGVAVVEVGDAEAVTGVFVGGGNDDCPRRRFCL